MFLPFLVVAFGQGVPKPEPFHREWGPTPPVAPYSDAALPGETIIVPMTFPVLGKCRWENGYGAERSGFKHTGIDIRAPKMTPIVAAFSGILGMKKESFWIYGDNGYATLGTHLNDDNVGKNDHLGDIDLMFAPGLHAGQHVVEGQFIGYVGQSGDATAPHLHFEIYATGSEPIQTRIRNPYPSLQRASVISVPVPTPSNPQDIPVLGEEKLEGCIRKLDEGAQTITLLLLYRQVGGGKPQVIVHPSWVKFHLNSDQLKEAGGWTILRDYKPNHLLTVISKPSNDPVIQILRFGTPRGVKISVSPSRIH